MLIGSAKVILFFVLGVLGLGCPVLHESGKHGWASQPWHPAWYKIARLGKPSVTPGCCTQSWHPSFERLAKVQVQAVGIRFNVSSRNPQYFCTELIWTRSSGEWAP